MSTQKITLEILSGPCDGNLVILEANTEWSQTGQGALCFPWDAELGAPQARLTVDAQGWWLEPVKSAHGTYRYRVSQREKLHAKVKLAKDDIIKASQTWWLIKNID